MGKIRCPLRPASMTLDRDRPEILQLPENPQACCAQQTITVPPDVLAKTAQKHDYPSAAWRRSYARRTGAERGFATAKDPASNTIARGWCRLMGLAPLMLFTTALLIVRNQRILHAWTARQEDNQRRAAAGLPPKTRKRRRKTSPPSPPGRPDPPPPRPRARARHHQHSSHNQAKARPGTGQTREPGPPRRPKTGTGPRATSKPECQGQT
jgi:hypothetical protein